jgi:hypothetical protein
MMALLPLAVLPAWPLVAVSGHIPRYWTWTLSLLLAGLITYYGLREWHDPAFWEFWRINGWHSFV